MWNVPGERSELSFRGDRIEEQDIAAAPSRPFYCLRIRRDRRRIGTDLKGAGRMIREHMVIEPKSYWKLDGACSNSPSGLSE